ncbi:hypothetical protein J1N35_013812 [Gossypium stocksii]|uniref:Uncharacterized protein n=1 Tax=Gossypium stocksii TaxID=47602 RepID=A0A9D4A964_9ROSI|nr:hypothetical protein J1N35_013812 [Gossypium stocksii]
MYDFYYMWSDEDVNYDEDIYEGVYEDWEIQKNQRLLMLELGQLIRETLVLPQVDNDHDLMPLERYQVVLSPKLSREENVIIDTWRKGKLPDYYPLR